MNKLEIRKVPFMGTELMAARDTDGQIWAGVRWMCHGIGLNKAQSKTQVEKSLNKNNAFTKTCYKTLFFICFICRYPKSPYLCTVFFIVLDLRLTKVGVQRYSFFYVRTFRNIYIRSGSCHKVFYAKISEILHNPAINRYLYFQTKTLLSWIYILL